MITASPSLGGFVHYDWYLGADIVTGIVGWDPSCSHTYNKHHHCHSMSNICFSKSSVLGLCLQLYTSYTLYLISIALLCLIHLCCFLRVHWFLAQFDWIISCTVLLNNFLHRFTEWFCNSLMHGTTELFFRYNIICRFDHRDQLTDSQGWPMTSLEASFARCFTLFSNIDKKLHR